MSFLKGCVIVITGDFGEEITQTKVKSWIKFNGGTFSADVNEDVTHLVCSREEWLKKGKLIQEAKQNGRIRIVPWDWLEDSLQEKVRKPEKKYQLEKPESRRGKKDASRTLLKSQLDQKTKGFQEGCESAKRDIVSGESSDGHLRQVLVEYNKNGGEGGQSDGAGSPSINNAVAVKSAEKEQTKKVARKKTPKPRKKRTKNIPEFKLPWSSAATNRNVGLPIETLPLLRPSLEEFKKEHAIRLEEYANSIWSFPEKHHIYVSPDSGETYDAKLVQIDLHHNKNQKVVLRLYESNSPPHLYATYVKEGTGNEKILAQVGSTWEVAYKGFKEEFKRWTAWEWDDRKKALGVWPPESADAMKNVEKPYLYAQAKYDW